jgi:sensor histidine kinase regulating citrate/malate metabolism
VLSGEENGKMFLEVGNVKRARQKIVEIKGKYGTTKENKEGHGYGMEIIREIAEKYNGKMEVRYAKDYFVNRVWISLE